MNKYLCPAVLATALLYGSSAFATSGYWSLGYGPKSKSMAGACVAMTYSAMCASSNPGALLAVGNQLEFGAALFGPDRGFTAEDNAMSPPFGAIDPGVYQSDNDLFVIPHLGYNRMLDENNSIGVALGANGGLNTEYGKAVFGNFSNPAGVASSPTGVDMKQMLMGIIWSHRLNDEHSFGISPVLAFQTLKVEGLEPFRAFSLHPDKVTNNGTDMSWGAGLKLGWLWQVNDRLRLGLGLQSRVYMTEFDEYAGLLAEQGDFDIPPNLDLGLAWKATPDLTLAFNLQRILFSDVSSVGNHSDLVFMPGQILLGTDKGLGFGWNDINIYKFGLEWKYSDDLTLRAGYAYSEEAVPPTQALFNIIAPAVVREHYAFGLGQRISDDAEINLSFVYAPEERLYGTNPNTGPQTGSLDMSQWEIEFGYSTSF